MAKLQKSQSNTGVEAEVYTPDSNSPTQVFNQQNNFHLSQHIDLGKLTNLSIKNPDEGQQYILNFLPEYNQWTYTIGGVYKHYSDKGYHTFVASRNMLNNATIKYKNNSRKQASKIKFFRNFF